MYMLSWLNRPKNQHLFPFSPLLFFAWPSLVGYHSSTFNKFFLNCGRPTCDLDVEPTQYGVIVNVVICSIKPLQLSVANKAWTQDNMMFCVFRFCKVSMFGFSSGHFGDPLVYRASKIKGISLGSQRCPCDPSFFLQETCDAMYAKLKGCSERSRACAVKLPVALTEFLFFVFLRGLGGGMFGYYERVKP